MDAVTLSAFTARASASGIGVIWETASEANVLGFNVWRSTRREGGFEKLNRALIPANVSGGSGGAHYEYLDQEVVSGQTYYYQLESVNIDGHRDWAGPISASWSVSSVYLPMVQQAGRLVPASGASATRSQANPFGRVISAGAALLSVAMLCSLFTLGWASSSISWLDGRAVGFLAILMGLIPWQPFRMASVTFHLSTAPVTTFKVSNRGPPESKVAVM
jgi:hypothetical protein